MTSMPASRSARAIIFAPRSWPSRPGFAISTRIFFSAICSLRSAQAFDEVLKKGIEAVGVVHEEGVADVFQNFHPRPRDALLHVLVGRHPRALRDHDQRGLIGFCERRAVVAGECADKQSDG